MYIYIYIYIFIYTYLYIYICSYIFKSHTTLEYYAEVKIEDERIESERESEKGGRRETHVKRTAANKHACVCKRQIV